MTSSNGNIFRITGPSWGEFTGHRWIPLTEASDVELWCLIWSAFKQTAEMPVIWDAIVSIFYVTVMNLAKIVLPKDSPSLALNSKQASYGVSFMRILEKIHSVYCEYFGDHLLLVTKPDFANTVSLQLIKPFVFFSIFCSASCSAWVVPSFTMPITSNSTAHSAPAIPRHKKSWIQVGRVTWDVLRWYCK